jgi:Family of unknown function (DUF6476)
VGLGQMRALKALVVVMGIMLIGGFAVLVVAIIGRVSHSGSPRPAFSATAIDIPREARVEAMTTGSDRLVIDLLLPESRRQLIVIDLTTGVRLGTIELRAAP